MGTAPVQAVTFDFWRTLFYKHVNYQERRDARVRVLTDLFDCDARKAKDALKLQEQEFMRTHVHEQRTLVPEDAVAMLAAKLGLALDAALAIELANALENATLEYRPTPIEGALEAVQAAAAQVPIGLISDTGLATGRVIRKLLEDAGFDGVFTSYTFSDEMGVSKPQAVMYNDAASKLMVPVENLLHIGDLEPTDITGALAVGARAILFAGDNDRFLNNTKAGQTLTEWTGFSDQVANFILR